MRVFDGPSELTWLTQRRSERTAQSRGTSSETGQRPLFITSTGTDSLAWRMGAAGNMPSIRLRFDFAEFLKRTAVNIPEPTMTLAGLIKNIKVVLEMPIRHAD